MSVLPKDPLEFMLKIPRWQKIRILVVRSTQPKGSGSNFNEKLMEGWRRRVMVRLGEEEREEEREGARLALVTSSAHLSPVTDGTSSA